MSRGMGSFLCEEMLCTEWPTLLRKKTLGGMVTVTKEFSSFSDVHGTKCQLPFVLHWYQRQQPAFKYTVQKFVGKCSKPGSNWLVFPDLGAGCMTEQSVCSLKLWQSHILNWALIPSTPWSQSWGVYAQTIHCVVGRDGCNVLGKESLKFST